MDHAVALVQAYLQANGYFTVAEFPVLEAMDAGGFRSATDVDLIGLRLPRAGGVVTAGGHPEGSATRRFAPDPALGVPAGKRDLLLAEVKEGRAVLNRGARDPDVLAAVLARFGCAPEGDLSGFLDALRRRGRATAPGGIEVRLFAFGSSIDPNEVRGFRALTLTHVTGFLREYLRDHWAVLRHAQIRHPALGYLALLEQVERVRDS